MPRSKRPASTFIKETALARECLCDPETGERVLFVSGECYPRLDALIRRIMHDAGIRAQMNDRTLIHPWDIDFVDVAYLVDDPVSDEESEEEEEEYDELLQDS